MLTYPTVLELSSTYVIHFHETGLALQAAPLSCAGAADWLPQLDGAWQLVFSAPKKTIPAWSYIPVNEDAVFNAASGSTSLASDLGPLHFDFIGDFSWDAQTQVRLAYGMFCISWLLRYTRLCGSV